MTSCVVKLSVCCISFLLLGDEREGEKEREPIAEFYCKVLWGKMDNSLGSYWLQSGRRQTHGHMDFDWKRSYIWDMLTGGHENRSSDQWWWFETVFSKLRTLNDHPLTTWLATSWSRCQGKKKNLPKRSGELKRMTHCLSRCRQTVAVMSLQNLSKEEEDN